MCSEGYAALWRRVRRKHVTMPAYWGAGGNPRARLSDAESFVLNLRPSTAGGVVPTFVGFAWVAFVLPGCFGLRCERFGGAGVFTVAPRLFFSARCASSPLLTFMCRATTRRCAHVQARPFALGSDVSLAISLAFRSQYRSQTSAELASSASSCSLAASRTSVKLAASRKSMSRI